MKLYLASEGIPSHLQQDFLQLVGKPASEIKLTHIANAAEPYPVEKRGFVKTRTDQFKAAGLSFDETDLKEFTNAEELYNHLKDYDVIWCGGGNTFYLRYLVSESGFEETIKRLLSEGRIYGGDSAGAIIMTPTLKYVELIDDPKDSPKVIREGLGLVDFAIVPHWGYKPYQDKLQQTKESLEKDKYKVKAITDNQAITVVDGVTTMLGQSGG